MGETPVFFSDSQARRIGAAVKRTEYAPRGERYPAASFRPPSYSLGEFKLHADLSDASTSGVAAKFYFGGTEGDDVTIFPGSLGVGGTVASGKIVAAYWWFGQWNFLAAESCPTA